ncbi:mitochondrial carrier domain-containing protein [Bisporella sp. PMI_857]|nr:mitochondrial carrier domain-containing protein [Bisporella sp. PMI_857]
MAKVYNSQLDAFTFYHKAVEEEKTPSAVAGPALPALGHALSGSAGTAISNLALYPLDLVITRLQVQRQLRKSSTAAEEGEYKGVLDAFNQIYTREGGVSAFYSGVIQDTGKSFADSFLFFLFYNYMRTSRLQKHEGRVTSLPVFDELSIGVLAGAFSKLFTTPIANIVTRKKTASMISARSGVKTSSVSVSDIASSIRSEKGFQGFWSGYSASLILTLNPSITFFLYEFFKRCLPRSRRDDPGAKLTFLMAAVSKAVASTITYPFSLAKTRAQVSVVPPVNPDSAVEIKEEVGTLDKTKAKKIGRDAKSITQRSTVFNTILEIYRSEGAAALYEGIFGEILKGFFSHGITMLIKEAIHKFIIQAYFLILKALNRYPSPSELAAQAGDIIQDHAEKVSGLVKEGYGNVTETASEIVKGSKEALSNSGDRIGVIGTNASGSAKIPVQNGKEAIGITGERAGVVGSNATEVAKNADDLASKEAGHLLGNAQEMLGDKVEEVGKGMKPDEK